MKNKTVMKIISICFIMFLLFGTFGNVYAEINTNYGENVPVNEEYLEEKLLNSTILEAVASLVNAVGSLVESVVGSAFYMLTGQNMFPWADKVIFNTVPFLDVNFLNPSDNSLFMRSGKETILANVIKNTYYTVLTLAIGFLGIIVSIMAIRLAISSIAAEKAKYKHAISKFLIALVMLFTVHYAISFIFYVNEKMVEMASSILTESLKDQSLENSFTDTMSPKTKVENFLVQQGYSKDSKEVKSIVENENLLKIGCSLIQNKEYKDYVLYSADGSRKERDPITKFFDFIEGKDEGAIFINHVNSIANGTFDKEEMRRRVESFKKGLDYYIQNEGKEEYDAALEKRLNRDVILEPSDNKIIDKNETQKENSGRDEVTINSDHLQKQTIQLRRDIEIEMETMGILLNVMDNPYAKPTSSLNTLAEMGEFFKTNAWTYGNRGWARTELSLQGALMYAIFVVQSAIFFIAYVKRFFYVVILALLAPAVVIYDFLGKSIL